MKQDPISLKCLVQHCAKSLADKCAVHVWLRYKYCHTSWKKAERSCSKGHNDKEQNNNGAGRSLPAKSKFQYLAAWLSVDTCTYTPFVGYIALLCWWRNTKQHRHQIKNRIYCQASCWDFPLCLRFRDIKGGAIRKVQITKTTCCLLS